MGRSQQTSMKDDEAFTKEWTHLSKINQCNNAKNSISADVHKTDELKPEEVKPDEGSQPSFSSNWTPLPSSNTINGMMKRAESKDSGWNFSEKPDTSESDLEQIELTSKEATEKLTATDETNGNGSNSDKTLESSDHERTSIEEIKTTADANVNKNVSKQCDSSRYHDDDFNSGEFTPLVDKGNLRQSHVAGGDS